MYLNGKKLQEIRLSRGLSQSKLAKKTGHTVGYISKLERGVSNPRLEVLNELATVLEIDYKELLV